MKHEKKKRGTKLNSSLFFNTEFKVCFIIISFSLFAFLTTFTFDEVPPILNRGIQPATFPKSLLVLVIALTFLIYYLSKKNPWKKQDKLPNAFFITLMSFVIFIIVGLKLDFFLGLSIFSLLISYYWGERRFTYLLMVSIIFPIIVFIFFETILGLRFPGGILTNIYYL